MCGTRLAQVVASLYEGRACPGQGELEKDVAVKGAGLAALLVVLSGTLPASAQLVLPGAVHALPPEAAAQGPRGSGDPTSGEAGQGTPKPARLHPPSEATLVGHDLARGGTAGVMAFRSAPAKGLEISSLSFVGEEIASPGAACRVDVVAGTPIVARFTGHSAHGLSRYEVEIAACPFSFEVLDGAVLVTHDPRACTFAAAECRVDPTGLWGPRGDEIDQRQIKQWERARAQAETSMRANFRALLASAGQDKDAVKAIAGEQAGFSSERSMACSTYAGEDLHGFCALRLTEARAVALQARREAAAQEKAKASQAKAGKAPAQSAVRKNAAP